MKQNVSTLPHKRDTPQIYFKCSSLSCCLEKPVVLSSSCHPICWHLLLQRRKYLVYSTRTPSIFH